MAVGSGIGVGLGVASLAGDAGVGFEGFIVGEGAERGFEAEEVVLVGNVVGDGFDDFAGSSGGATFFAESSRTLLRILDVSGVTGVLGCVFAGGSGVVSGAGGGLEVAFGVGAGASIGFVADLAAVDVFADAAGFVLVVFAVALVDFAREVVFFVVSGISESMGSERTFLGLPLFFTTSEDILLVQLS